MTRKAQKERESKFLLHFKELYPEFPIGQLELGESPDFVITSKGNRKIGIELVEIFPNLTHEEKSHLQLIKNKSILIELARQRFESNFQTCLMVSFTFSRNFRCSKSHRNEFARLIVEDVHNCYTSMNDTSKNYKRFDNT